ncbi:RNA polymerase factor sigma-54 [Paenibacillus sp. GCM10027628]|uniref:RNA polymerase factor sigma-54 n=1 Tax=Paenibacillus sp. GCM10027628 TaxID=3273413 RepID=UPI00362AC85E
MALSLSLSNKMNIQLTPQLRQSIEILHMSSLDLVEFVKEEAKDNPLLEYRYESFMSRMKPSSRHKADWNNEWWLNIESKQEQSLEAHLTEQLHDYRLDSELYKITLFIIRSLDEKGYLPFSAEGIAEVLHVPVDAICRAIQIVQKMEPRGIAASSLQECLLLQLDPDHGKDPLVRRLIEEDLYEIAKRKFTLLAKKYNVDLPDILQAVGRISRLDPKPGALYTQEKTQYIQPDVTVTNTNDKVEIMMHDASLPRITLNEEYMEMMKGPLANEVSSFLGEKWKRVKSIIDSIEHRKATLLKVASVIFDHQHVFCQNGPAAIRPLSMWQVAEILGIHESTVSRAVNQKYAMTPWGLFELKHFFSSSIKQSDNDAVSAIQIKQKIRELVERENKSEPLSDQKLTDQLQEAGLRVSRRTVTKYREQLNILVAAERKQYAK